MFPETFERILQHIGPLLRNNNAPAIAISEKKQLLISIWFMTKPDTYRYISYSQMPIEALFIPKFFFHKLSISQ